MKIQNSLAVIEVYWFKDYLWSDVDFSQLVKPVWTNIEYNQKEFGFTMDCTAYACFYNFSNLTWVILDESERREFIDYCHDNWIIDINQWAYLHIVVDEFRKWINNKDYDLKYIRVSIWSQDYYDLLNKGYTIITGFYWNSQFKKDRQDNCLLDWLIDEDWTYWHCINNLANLWVQDNYSERKCNKYKINEDFLESHYFNYWYVFLNTKQDIKMNAIKRETLEMQLSTNSNTANILSDWDKVEDDPELRKKLKDLSDWIREKYWIDR